MPTVDLEPHHRFHSYCARFPSEIVEAALEQYTVPGESVLDLFCGSGTTLVACLAHGRTAVGTDIDVLAGMLSEVKCQPRSGAEYDAWRPRFATRITAAFEEIERAWKTGATPPLGGVWSIGSLQLPVPSFPELSYWFPPQLTAALAAIAHAAHRCKDPHYERVALIALSASIIAKWPNTLSYAMDIDHTRPHRRMQRFTLERIRDTYLDRLDRCTSCLKELHRIYGLRGAAAPAATVVCPHDARCPLPGIPDGSQALVVTSPPYFNAVDYPRAHRLSVCWMNGHAPADLVSRRQYVGLRCAGTAFDPDEWLDERPAVRAHIPAKVRKTEDVCRKVCAFYADLSAVLGQAWRALRPGGRAVFVIANNVIRGVRVESHEILLALAREAGFPVGTAKPREIAGARRRFPVGPFGFDGPMTHEFVVALQKPKPRTRPARGRHARSS